MSLEFFEDTACFRHPPEHETCVEEFDGLLAERNAGRMGEKRYVDGLQDIAERHPWFIDAHAHLGNVLLNRRKPEPALEAYLKGLALGEAAIPPGYAGLIEWTPLENRPFFRAAHGAILCHLHLRQWSEAIELMSTMLVRDPGDNLGIRHLLGSAYLRSGRRDEARALPLEFRGEEPSLHYELALLRWLEGQFRAAATSLRHGFVANGYVAEMICGTPDPLPMAIWHRSNLAGPDCARDYVEMFGELWKDTPEAVKFVRWLHIHPEVMAERVAILACDEELLWERDVGIRGTIADRRDVLALAIDDSLSDRIVTRRTDRDGNTVWPWLHAASCQ